VGAYTCIDKCPTHLQCQQQMQAHKCVYRHNCTSKNTHTAVSIDTAANTQHTTAPAAKHDHTDVSLDTGCGGMEVARYNSQGPSHLHCLPQGQAHKCVYGHNCTTKNSHTTVLDTGTHTQGIPSSIIHITSTQHTHTQGGHRSIAQGGIHTIHQQSHTTAHHSGCSAGHYVGARGTPQALHEEGTWRRRSTKRDK